MPKALANTIGVVTGASRGVGKGIALGLGEAGATVYLTGRTLGPGEAHWPGTLLQTAEEITQLGGH
jgi:dehydrogenase/reductase SDR family member 1